MKQKDKELILKDLCARSSYGVILQVGIFDNGDIKYHNEKLDYHSKLLSLIGLDGGYYLNGHLYKYSQFTAKPYLRPMSSMTEEEIDELKELCTMYEPSDSPNIAFEDYGIRVLTHHLLDNSIAFSLNMEVIDWLNARHFDYRGLLEKGLAIAVTKENNPYED